MEIWKSNFSGFSTLACLYSLSYIFYIFIFLYYIFIQDPVAIDLFDSRWNILYILIFLFADINNCAISKDKVSIFKNINNDLASAMHSVVKINKCFKVNGTRSRTTRSFDAVSKHGLLRFNRQQRFKIKRCHQYIPRINIIEFNR